MPDEFQVDASLERLWYAKPRRIRREAVSRLERAIGAVRGDAFGVPQDIVETAGKGDAAAALEYAERLYDNVAAVPKKGRRLAIAALVLIPSAHRGNAVAAGHLGAMFQLSATGTFDADLFATLGACWRQRLEVLVQAWTQWVVEDVFMVDLHHRGVSESAGARGAGIEFESSGCTIEEIIESMKRPWRGH